MNADAHNTPDPSLASLPAGWIGAASALFLDFDGTLVDLAERPEGVFAPAGLLDTLTALRDALGGALAVVSGRPIEQLDHFLAPLTLAAAGVHGAERRSADGTLTHAEVPSLARVDAAAVALQAQHPALLIERKRGSLALHYRAAPQLQAICTAAMHNAVHASDGLVLLPGKMVLEAKAASIGKGIAIAALLREPPFAGRTPIFIGDDVTDEAGFDAVQAAGGRGIKVGPEASSARLRLNSPDAVRTALMQAAQRLAGPATNNDKTGSSR